MDMLAKVGPLSIQKPLQDRMEGIEEYFKHVPQEIPHDTKEAIELWTKEFKSIYKSIRGRNFDRVVENMKLNTNSGVPFFTRRNKVVAETRQFMVT